MQKQVKFTEKIDKKRTSWSVSEKLPLGLSLSDKDFFSAKNVVVCDWLSSFLFI